MGQDRRPRVALALALASCSAPPRETAIENRATSAVLTVRLARPNELPRTQSCELDGDFAPHYTDALIAFTRAELVDDDGELVTTRIVRPDEASMITASSGIDIGIQPRAKTGIMVVSFISPTSIASATYCLHVRERELIVERR